MSLPRWTVYPALIVIGAFLVLAIPKSLGGDPHAGAASLELATDDGFEGGKRTYQHEPVVVLGIDGMDPDILMEVMEKYGDRMPNFRWLLDQNAGKGGGAHSLGTSTPPQSPVAWSNFITGMNPGGHGIYDFIHRDPVHRAPTASTTVIEESSNLPLPGDWKLMIGGDSPTNRTGESFWMTLADHGVPADIWRMPANFPVEPSRGLSFPGMMTPALDSAYGQCSFFTTDVGRHAYLDYDKAVLLRFSDDGKYLTSLQGPPNPFKDGDPVESAPITIYVDKKSNAVAIDAGEDRVVLQPGQWSHFVRLDFEMLPMGAMNMSGICRFYLRSIEPELELYASPVNLDPDAPAAPVSEPSDASEELAGRIGRYYTQGMAEDVNALKYEVLTDAEFMQQVELVYQERRHMMDYALDEYLRNDDGGLLFFYYSTVDLSCHMMWRHFDSSHPAHDAELAAQSSTAWSKREGSTWRDTVHDLYLRMDPVLGRLRQRLGDDVTYIVMSDHGFAPYRREFSLNTWLLENGYLVLRDGFEKELPHDDPAHRDVAIFDIHGEEVDGEVVFRTKVDWSKTRAYGMGFNGLYLNLAGRELDNPDTPEDESGIVKPGEAEALLREIKRKLEAVEDPEAGVRPVLRCDLATEAYSGTRVSEAPDLLVGYNAGYGNSDAASLGRIPHAILEDNTGGTFNGNHLMAPEVVAGILISNRPVRPGEHKLEDLTVEILRRYGVKSDGLEGHRVLADD